MGRDSLRAIKHSRNISRKTRRVLEGDDTPESTSSSPARLSVFEEEGAGAPSAAVRDVTLSGSLSFFAVT